jgi:hypothetical protein
VFDLATNEQVYNQENEYPMGTNTYIGTNPNVDDYYKSPWNIDSLRRVIYMFDSNFVNNNDVYVRVTPYIGLAYYDGANDGIYNTPTGTYNLNSGAYPNLTANGEEYGNYIQANPIVLASPSINQKIMGRNWYTHELMIQSTELHCPLGSVPIGYNYNLYAINFNVRHNQVIQPTAHLGGATITPAPPIATTAEEFLLGRYGKVFYYKIEYGIRPDLYYNEAFYTLALEADITTHTTLWHSLPKVGSGILKDTPFNSDLYYYNNGGTGSKEIVVDRKIFWDQSTSHIPHDVNFSTLSGTRKVRGVANYYPVFPTTIPPVIIKDAAEPHGIMMHFH